MKAILVDDQDDSIKVLSALLNKYAPEIEIVSTHNDSSEALAEIRKVKPDVLFADVEMPGLSGFELKKLMENTGTKVIFVTGHTATAVEALRAGAFDFLEKPVNSSSLLNCIARLKENIDKTLSIDQKSESKERPFKNKVLINKHDRAVIIDEDEIIFIQAFGAYTTVYYTPQKSIESSRPIAYYNDTLNPETFYRVHRSYLVNLNHVKEITKKENVGLLHMRDGHSIELAKNQLYKLLGLLSNDKKDKISE